MPVDYHHPPERDFLSRARGGTARTLADHVAPGPAPRPAVMFLGRVRGGSQRTLADHLNPPTAAPPAVPARPVILGDHGIAPPARPTPALPRPGTARESERRTVLDADSPVITFGADLRRTGRLTIALSWTPQLTSGGLRRSTDVHLGCLWQTSGGESGVLQSVDGLLSAPGFGSRQAMRLVPRNEEEGEAITVDLATLATMRRLLLFGYGQHGPPAWAALGVRLTFALPSGAQVLLWPGPFAADVEASVLTVALASVHLVDDDVIVRREDEPFTGPAREVARAYGWDVPWNTAGTAPRR